MRLLFFFFFFSNILFSSEFFKKGMLCRLDNEDKYNNLFEAYAFDKDYFVSFYFDISNDDIIIKKGLPEKYTYDKEYLIIRGLKINRKTLKYKTMGGNYLCKLMKKNQLLDQLNDIKDIKKITK